VRVLFVSSEVAPYSKTGGLGDVAGALPAKLAELGHDVAVVTPLYSSVKQGDHSLLRVFDAIPVPAAGNHEFSSYLSQDGRTWFVDSPPLYSRAGLYTNDPDEDLRFLFLTHAAIELCRRREWSPDIAHGNDWQTGFLPLYLKSLYAFDPLFADSRSVFTIHNLGYQGVFGTDILPDLSLGEHQHLLHQDHLREGRINFMEHGLLYADLITTVSPTYAREIQTSEHGASLDGLLRARSSAVVGILNGIDRDVWDPRIDPHLPVRYSELTLADKQHNKRHLLESRGLDPEMGVPLVGLVARLTGQKGIELMIRPLARALAAGDVRLVALGSGEPIFEEALQWLADSFPGLASFHRGYDEHLAHLIEGGADVFPMPSRYEPSGLNQMYSLAYGTVPIVRKTGGLADTVSQYDPGTGEGTGIVFDHYTEDGLTWALDRALRIFPDKDAWRRMQLNGMAQDNSWETRAAEYDQVYRRLAGLEWGGTAA
jgi:starch synthase